jgi:tRNA-specific 2-thiouridylase
VRCNTFTKFRDLLHKADAIDAQWLATGHYARVSDGVLYRGRDDNKDQTYFLWGIDRAVLERMILPVGNSTKDEIRAAARQLGLAVVADKPESQEICFVPDVNYVRILEKKLGTNAPALMPGPIMTSDGTVIGRHDGHARYTIGQRRGLPGGYKRPLYVIAIRPQDRAVVVGPREELLGRGIIAREVNWLVDAPVVNTAVTVRIRHRAPLARGEIVRIERDEVEIALDEPVAAIAPGQSLVLYDGERVLGGGFIESAPTVQRRVLPILAA